MTSTAIDGRKQTGKSGLARPQKSLLFISLYRLVERGGRIRGPGQGQGRGGRPGGRGHRPRDHRKGGL